MEQGIEGERLVGHYTEIMPGRPTVSEHRYPYDDVKRCVSNSLASPLTKLHTCIITAAEQQTMNYYMNIGTFYTSDLGRKLFHEIGMIEEQHVSQYESLMDSSATWLEMLLWHEYLECYLYWSCYKTETDPKIKNLWEQNLSFEIAHLHKAVELLKKYEGKDWQEVIRDGEFPAPISLHENIDYVRNILGNTVQYTSLRENYALIKDLPENYDFFTFQNTLNPNTDIVPSHNVIEKQIARKGMDYRYQVALNPVFELQNRRVDNTDVGRKPNATTSTDFYCNR
jgi:hypothetical protein